VQRNFYYIDGPITDDFFLRNPDQRVWHQRYTTITRQFYVQDRFRLFDDRLTIDIGAKSPHTRTSVRTPLGSYANNSSLTSKKGSCRRPASTSSSTKATRSSVRSPRTSPPMRWAWVAVQRAAGRLRCQREEPEAGTVAHHRAGLAWLRPGL
jgi:phosphatidylserine/phosphatidylglycerophosphate/cardiolipin synthase-like enzyme